MASVYERVVDASLSEVWENVFDWEHLSWLHDQAFESIELIDRGEWGWLAEIGFPGGGRSTIELVVDRAAERYVARTLEGAGAPSEIWTSLRVAKAEAGAEAGAPNTDPQTQIRVEFCVPDAAPEALELIGKTYLAVYAQLWDQDEEMMQVRASGRRAGSAPGGAADSAASEGPVELGLASDLRKRLPMLFEWRGHSFRLIEESGQFRAHSAKCPHWGGPLSDCEVDKGEITCPWHGYRFGVEDGRSSDGRGLRLRPAPRIQHDAESDRLIASAG